MQINGRARALLSLLIVGALPGVAAAQTAYLEDSGIVGQGKTLSISRLPVADATGKISYDDVTIAFTASASGVLSQFGKARIAPSPILVTNHFIAGRYYVKYSNAKTEFGDLSSGVGSGGATVWSLAMEESPDGDFPDQATWQTGMPAPDVAARLRAAKVQINPDYSYGLTAVGGCCGGPDAFNASDGLLAAEQVNGDLTLFSYTDRNGGDQSTATGSIIFGLCADQACSNAPP